MTKELDKNECEYTQEEIAENGNMMYGGKRHDILCDQFEKDYGASPHDVNIFSSGVWKGIESERKIQEKKIEELRHELTVQATGRLLAEKHNYRLEKELESLKAENEKLRRQVREADGCLALFFEAADMLAVDSCLKGANKYFIKHSVHLKN